MEKFNFIFTGDLSQDAIRIGHYIDEYYTSCGLPIAEIDLAKIMGVASGMVQDFPSPHGVGDSSPFKKAASFTAYFAAARPILTPLPETIFGPLCTHQNSIIAIELSLDALEKATFKWKDGTDVTLDNRIEMSAHFWKDFVAAISCCVPVHHFECLSLIYESLAYQKNPHASYNRV